MIKVKRFISHPRYDRNTLRDDIALIELTKSIRFRMEKSLVVPACMPTESFMSSISYDQDPDNRGEPTLCKVTGWGETTYGGNTSNKLRYASIPLMKNSVCNKYML